MVRELPPDVWFVRSNGGSGSYPIRREGWNVVWRFIRGMTFSAVATVALVLVGTQAGPMWLTWLGAGVFVAGATWSAWQFIDAARKHTSYDITYNDWVAQRSGR